MSNESHNFCHPEINRRAFRVEFGSFDVQVLSVPRNFSVTLEGSLSQRSDALCDGDRPSF